MSLFYSAGLGAAAIPDGVVDNFELESGTPVGPYQSGDTIATFYSGSTGNFQRVQTNITEGSFGLEFTAGATAIWSHPGDGLLEYPQEGDTVSFLIRDSSGVDFPLALTNVQDDASPNCYGFEIDQGNNNINIFRYDNGNFGNFGTNLESTSVTISGGTWYLGEVSLPVSGTNQITFELFDLDANNEKSSSLGSVQTTDSNVSPTNRGIGWATRTGSVDGSGAFFDRFRVEP